MYDVDLSKIIHFYTDASGCGVGLAITQFRKEKPEALPVEVPALHDSLSFTSTQRPYSTYKKELCFMVQFVGLYDHLCKHPYNQTVIRTDHRPLIHFLKSDLPEEFYGHL